MIHAHTGSNLPLLLSGYKDKCCVRSTHPFCQLIVAHYFAQYDKTYYFSSYFGACMPALMFEKQPLICYSVGVSPHSYNGLSPGDHRLRIVPEGCLSNQGQTYRFTV